MRGDEDMERSAWPLGCAVCDEQRGKTVGTDLIFRILETVGCETWERMKGCNVYVLKADGEVWIRGIANAAQPERKYLLFKEHRARFTDPA